MNKYLSIIVIRKNKILVRKHRLKKRTWNFIGKTLKPEETWVEVAHRFALQNFNPWVEVKRFGGQEYEETGDVEEFWAIRLEPTTKLPWYFHLLYECEWIGKEEAKVRTRNYGPDVFHYIQYFFGYVND